VAKTKLLNNMISAIEADAYRRGFNDGLRAAMRAVKGLRPTAQHADADAGGAEPLEQPDPVPSEAPPKPPRQLRENSDQMRVLKAIQSSPGMRGVEILRTLEAAGTPVHERTLRTALARLKGTFIEQREERWYELQSADH
jgi:hypothetical protein